MKTCSQTHGFVFVLLLTLACVSCAVLIKCRVEEMQSVIATQMAVSQATLDTEMWLTQTYGEQVSEIIEEFELKRHSLDYIQGENNIYGTPIAEPGSVWMIVTTASVKGIRVLEYTPERIKAIATVDRTYDERTIEGDMVNASLSDYKCGIYVFVNEDSTWKLAGFFLTTPPRAGTVYNDWYYLDEEKKEFIGGLPDGDLCPE